MPRRPAGGRTLDRSGPKQTQSAEKIMARTFGATSTTDEVLDGVNLSGKRILVTGVSAGLGVETARALAAHGARVVGAARDLDKAKAATAQVRADAANGGEPGTRCSRPRLARQRARLRRRAGRRRQAVRSRHRQRRRHGLPEGPDGRRLRNPVRHQPPRPFRPGQPHRLAAEARGAAGQSLLGGPPLFRRRPRRPEFRAHALYRVRAPTAVPRPPTSCSPSSSTAGTRDKACGRRRCIPAASRPSLAAT